jgi:hypothetical protein
MYMSMQSILHSRFPSKFRSHSTPKPVHSALLEEIWSAAAPANVLAVEFAISNIVALKDGSVYSDGMAVVLGRGRNQLLRKSKKHRSDQLQDVRNNMRSRMEQYTQGRLRK